MATVTVSTMVDDLDGGEAARTASFCFEGEHYEIDLSDENFERLRLALEPYLVRARVAAAASSNGRKRARGPAKARPGGPNRDYDPVDVRRWGSEHGFETRSSGRMSRELLDAYRDAHGMPIPSL